MPILKAINSKASLSNAMGYVLRKSDYSDGIGCRVESALEEMAITKTYYGQERGRAYAHLVISYPPGVGNAEEVLSSAQEFVKRCPQLQGFETVIGVHTDREHLHAHIIINSVSLSTGRKLHMSKQDLQSMKELQNAICLEHGFDPPEKKRDELEVGQVQNPWTFKLLMARQNDVPVKSWLYDIAEAIVEASEKAKSKDDFLQLLGEFGVSADWSDSQKNITYHTVIDGVDRKVRASRLKKMLALACEKEELLHVFEENERESRTLCRSVEDCTADINCIRAEVDGFRTEIEQREAELSSRQDDFRKRQAGLRELESSSAFQRLGTEKDTSHARGGRVRER